MRRAVVRIASARTACTASISWTDVAIATYVAKRYLFSGRTGQGGRVRCGLLAALVVPGVFLLTPGALALRMVARCVGKSSRVPRSLFRRSIIQRAHTSTSSAAPSSLQQILGWALITPTDIATPLARPWPQNVATLTTIAKVERIHRTASRTASATAATRGSSFLRTARS